MKKTALFLALVAVLAACHDKVYNKYMACTPVYTDYETFRIPATFGPAKPITSNGSLYIKDNYLFVIEPDNGIHFLDNSNPAAPAKLGFLNLKGCTGMAIRDNYLFANSFIDLVVFDISTITAPVEINREKDLFPQALPVIKGNYPVAAIDKNMGVVTSWIYEEVKEEVNGSQMVWNNCVNCDMSLSSSSFESVPDPSGNSGTSGSYSKFTIIGDYLYIMDFNELKPVNIANPAAMTVAAPVGVWNQVETLFPHDGYIFMGTTTGMMIYGTSIPEAPNYVSSVTHMRGCDPVVVQDNYCYVTIRSNGDCGGDLNQLDVIDISDINNPVLKNSFGMDQPHGVGIDGSLLFICDGESGLKIYDSSDPLTCGNNLLKHYADIHASDVIPYNNVAIVIGDDGIRQYDYSDLNNFILLSSINY